MSTPHWGPAFRALVAQMPARSELDGLRVKISGGGQLPKAALVTLVQLAGGEIVQYVPTLVMVGRGASRAARRQPGAVDEPTLMKLMLAQPAADGTRVRTEAQLGCALPKAPPDPTVG